MSADNLTGACPVSGKDQFASAGKARRVLGGRRIAGRFQGSSRGRTRDKADVYQCEHCGQWHIGRRSSWVR